MPSSLLAETVAAHGENRPHRTAFHFTDRAVTYGRLNDLTGSLRAQLARLRLPAGSTVCVPAHKDPQTIALLLAVFREGHIALAPSPGLGSAALERLAHQARVSHLLTAAADGTLTALPVRAEHGEAEGFAVPDPQRTQLLLTTSGSTGTPKIVPIETAGFDAFADWAVDEFALTPDETALSYAPLNFDLALLDVWTFLRLGASVVLVEQQRATDAAHLAALAGRHDVTFVQGVPMMYRLLLEGGGTFAAVRHAVFTGDRMPVDLLRRVPPAFPRAAFHNVFGCTETNDSFIHRVDPAAVDGPVPIGRPIRGTDALVVDAEGARLDSAGTGELLVSTPFQTGGYLRQDLNDAVFTHLDGRVFYRTGDIVTRTAEGLHFLEGRADWHVKVRGVRTNLQEVENVITAHPDVAEAVVVPLPDPQAGVRLHAHVTRRPGADLTSLRLRTHLGRQLPRHAIPASVHLTAAPLPRTSTGKPDRNLIKQNLTKGSDA
ncbi:acyl-CoA synthetase (AMP-forming)/AMP-acid ligase II [Kitasatospora sp. SolWspMP-SS2h]|uniref:AMP-binding protein n=1 Tax=Kitasatospora sp. SolWspMP-SS2h TaxID=1305729 RepID=UPI000DB911A5|nr:AMP-binding protein [Kitasatospora sp. SolWspMP-SS2h]RAJ45675.1 acyl-CoA synthetase (AMP-forming)/AMP-acid ligase II [Kitasatospora sp. SolWspMP-SS2h]